MKKYLVALLLVACNPIDDAVDNARAQCEEVFNEQYEQVKNDIWLQCTSFYENTVIPQFESGINGLITEFESLLESVLHDAEVEFMTRIGCVPTIEAPGWNCKDTSLCL